MTDNDKNNQGIALVIVLGFLSLLTLMAVSFVIYARTERMVAATSADSKKAEQLIQVALTRAVDDIDQAVSHDLYPAFSTPGFADLMVSEIGANEDGDSFGNDETPLDEGLISYLSVYDFDNPPPNLLNTIESAEWINVKFRSDPGKAGPDQVAGRIAYFILNCSGLLDMNYAGGNYDLVADASIERTNSVSPNEISLTSDLVPAFNSAVADTMAKEIKKNRDIVKRYDTMADLAFIGNMDVLYYYDESEPEEEDKEKELHGCQFIRTLNSYPVVPKECFTYSRAENRKIVASGAAGGGYEYAPPPVERRIFLPADSTALKAVPPTFDRVEIENIFQKVFPATPIVDTTMMFDYLVQYADDDNFINDPALLKTMCTESTPLINEVQVTASINSDGGLPPNYSMTIGINVELWYNFLSDNDQSYSLKVDVATTGGNLVFNPLTKTIASTKTPPNTWKTDDYEMLSDSFVSSADPAPIDFDTVTLTLTLNDGANNPVDQTTFPLAVGEYPTWANLTPAPVAYECNDPRLNWDKTQFTLHPGPALGTPGTINDTLGGVVPERFFIKNLPLNSLMELTWLPSATLPWNAVKFDNSADPNNGSALLDELTMLPAKNYLFGYVNPNSKNVNVLASLFFNYDMNQSFKYTFKPGGYPLITVPVAQLLAQELIKLQPVVFRSDLKKLDATKIAEAFGLNPESLDPEEIAEFQRLKEAVMAAAVELIEPKQQMYTIVMAAQAGAMDDGVPPTFHPTVEKRALAVVWRDPIRDADGEHPCFVRFLKWIDWE